MVLWELRTKDPTADAAPGDDAIAPLRARRRFLLGLVVGSVVASVASLSASTLVKSPEQAAAEAGPPQASVITAPVERRVLKETVVMRGSVAPGKTLEITPSASGEGRSVVTRAPMKKGGRITPGKVLVEISGRPVIALQGRIPAYRDIRPGVKGPDVGQLQTALRGLGYSVTDPARTFGAGTQAAVKKLYVDRGYEAPTVSAEPTTDEGGKGTEGDEPVARPYLKAGEVAFIPRFPARVTEVKAGLGDEVEGPVLKLAAGELVVRGTLSSADHKLVKTGKPVKIFSEESGVSASGQVTSIGAQTTSEQNGVGYPVTIRGNRALPERLAGQDVRLTIEAAATDGPVLVVPAAAIYGAADGSTQVIKLTGGTQRRIAVTTGATGAGYVEIRGAGLAEGDKVVVGK